MINSLDEYLSIYTSDVFSDSQKVITEKISDSVLHDILRYHPELKIDLAKNKYLPECIIESLAVDEDWHVRYFIAMKRSLSDNIFLKLAKDKDESVRRRVVNNLKTPIFVLELLSNDSVHNISERACENLKKRREH